MKASEMLSRPLTPFAQLLNVFGFRGVKYFVKKAQQFCEGARILRASVDYMVRCVLSKSKLSYQLSPPKIQDTFRVAWKYAVFVRVHTENFQNVKKNIFERA